MTTHATAHAAVVTITRTGRRRGPVPTSRLPLARLPLALLPVVMVSPSR
ncbi:hypothetical protein E4N62_17140 [Streptomyces sp. MNU76]|nr:hypothetical protein [Streptomyces sp. MNU76]MCC9706844.1 hypothetical protein [Streptomyces sp. MNU76]